MPRAHSWNWSLFLLSLQTGLLCPSCNAQDSERDVLASFYNRCNGRNWIDGENWLDDTVNVCAWSGIKCSSNLTVTEVELRSNNVVCELPENLFYLADLQVLDVSGNNELRIDFTKLNDNRTSALARLYFGDADVQSLRGIDVAFEDTLVALGAAGNRFTGEFPPEVLSLTGLRQLDLSYNFLSGRIPDELGDMTNLVRLYLSHNILTGQIPDSLANVTELSYLQLQHNELSGTIPQSFSEHESLNFLTLNDQTQGITGPLPDFNQSVFLFHLDVSGNQLTGQVPSNLLASIDPEFSNILNVDLSGNNLEGGIPEELGRFDAIRLYLVDNQIDNIPSNICSQSEWLFGGVSKYGCDAILCPPGTFGLFGRQVDDNPCEPCQNGTAEFFGSTHCEVEPEQQQLSTLENLLLALRALAIQYGSTGSDSVNARSSDSPTNRDETKSFDERVPMDESVSSSNKDNGNSVSGYTNIFIERPSTGTASEGKGNSPTKDNNQPNQQKTRRKSKSKEPAKLRFLENNYRVDDSLETVNIQQHLDLKSGASRTCWMSLPVLVAVTLVLI